MGKLCKKNILKTRYFFNMLFRLSYVNFVSKLKTPSSCDTEASGKIGCVKNANDDNDDNGAKE